MPPSTIPSTSSAISSPGRRFGSSDPKRRRNGAARPTRHDDGPRPRILTRTPQLDSARPAYCRTPALELAARRHHPRRCLTRRPHRALTSPARSRCEKSYSKRQNPHGPQRAGQPHRRAMPRPCRREERPEGLPPPTQKPNPLGDGDTSSGRQSSAGASGPSFATRFHGTVMPTTMLARALCLDP
jgi:hypothetical protein